MKPVSHATRKEALAMEINFENTIYIIGIITNQKISAYTLQTLSCYAPA